jgi:hypothetical protein
VLSALLEQGYVAQTPGRADRRQRLLTLTPTGQALERRLYERQRERLSAAYREAGAAAVDGFRKVMRGIMDEAARAYLDGADRAGTYRAGREPRPLWTGSNWDAARVPRNPLGYRHGRRSTYPGGGR